MFKLT